MDGAEEQGATRPAAIMADADMLDRARFGFHRATPARSARRVLHWTQIFALCVIGGGLYFALKDNAPLTGRILLWVAYGVFAVATLWRLYAAANLTPVLSRLGEPADRHWPTYTLLCPLHDEADIVPDLVAALDRLDYPGME